MYTKFVALGERARIVLSGYARDTYLCRGDAARSPPSFIPPMTPTIHLVRHAQAVHNVEGDGSIPDAPLTQLGREQAAGLNRDTVQNIQQTAELLIASPLTRALQTTILGFPVLIARLEAQVVAGEPKKGIVVQSRLQEAGTYPCKFFLNICTVKIFLGLIYMCR